jgi:N-acetylglutamate synthase-like GNAT family acetyltransferase
MTEIVIRKAQLKDAQKLSDLICENAQQILKPHYSEEQWNSFIKYYSTEVMEKKIENQSLFCADKNNEIVATIALNGDFVVGFYTRLQNLNQGIGKKLLNFLENYAYNNGLKKLQLAASPEGVSFYTKNGWHIIENSIIEYNGVGFEETLMFKHLS